MLSGQFAFAAVDPVHALPVPALPHAALNQAAPQGLPEDYLLVQSIPDDDEGQFVEPTPSPSIYTDPYADERDPGISTTYDLDDLVTRGVSGLIDNGSWECAQSLPPEYRIDCLRSVLARAASVIEGRPDYREAARELRALSRKLDDIVERYKDETAPRAAVKQRSYRGVSQANLDAATQEATSAIEETATKLLRSAGNSEKRKIHYAQISRAVGSTKTLLRS